MENILKEGKKKKKKLKNNYMNLLLFPTLN